MTRGITFVGMDVHKASINVAVLEPGNATPTEWVVENRASLVAKLGQKLKKDYGGAVTCCYEAGPCGFALMRDLTSMGITCKVIAPSLIPKQPGNRVKTDRRDARRLASLFQAGLLNRCTHRLRRKRRSAISAARVMMPAMSGCAPSTAW